MGSLSFIGILRKGSSGQIVITIPRRFRDLVSTDTPVYILISNRKEDMSKGESISYIESKT